MQQSDAGIEAQLKLFFPGQVVPKNLIDRYMNTVTKERVRANKLSFAGHDGELRQHLDLLNMPSLSRFLVFIPFESFQDIQKVGVGGFSTVYKAKILRKGPNIGEPDIIMEVALKEMDRALLTRELILTTYLSFHRSGISPVMELIGFTWNPRAEHYNLVMEFASGGNLDDFLLNSPPESWELVVYLAKRITSNLRCIQDIGLLHQDLHPGNIVFDNGTPRIIDVGLSRIIEVEEQNDSVYGRKAYLPPEYFVGGQYTQKSEIYCLGTILWQLVSGVAPRHTAGEIDRRDGMREEMVPGMPAGYEAIVRDCWNLDPSKRPTIEEIEQRLGDMEQERGIQMGNGRGNPRFHWARKNVGLQQIACEEGIRTEGREEADTGLRETPREVVNNLNRIASIN
ncbi:kinase-like domain-containing protein [Endogone sp. FLAS-F59071]|nr:kinase-like domain-containing protein [Endogone sp. FLAS-F59071]|eukprot:RUS14562.1 kinase-like domain-containing protein [Endogone sp. FLAS-F59071]